MHAPATVENKLPTVIVTKKNQTHWLDLTLTYSIGATKFSCCQVSVCFICTVRGFDYLECQEAWTDQNDR